MAAQCANDLHGGQKETVDHILALPPFILLITLGFACIVAWSTSPPFLSIFSLTSTCHVHVFPQPILSDLRISSSQAKPERSIVMTGNRCVLLSPSEDYRWTLVLTELEF